MSNRIESLTGEQEKQMDDYFKECYKKAISIEPINKEVLEENIRKLYKLHGHKTPEIVYADSIYHAQLIINAFDKGCEIEDLDEKGLDYYETWLAGQHGYYWVAFYTFPEKYLGVEYTEENAAKLECFRNIADVGHWWWMFEELCVVSERPNQIHFNEDYQLHNEEGAAIEYKDGYKQYFVDGELASIEKKKELQEKEERKTCIELLRQMKEDKKNGTV